MEIVQTGMTVSICTSRSLPENLCVHSIGKAFVRWGHLARSSMFVNSRRALCILLASVLMGETAREAPI